MIPLSVGPKRSPLSEIGAEISDSARVVVNMRIMTSVGTSILEDLGSDKFILYMDSVGQPPDNFSRKLISQKRG